MFLINILVGADGLCALCISDAVLDAWTEERREGIVVSLLWVMHSCLLAPYTGDFLDCSHPWPVGSLTYLEGCSTCTSERRFPGAHLWY